MLPICRIWAVALYEAKLLLRNWAFRIFAIFVMFLSVLLFAMPYEGKGLGWVPAMIPLREFVSFSFFLAWVITVLVPELLAVDRRCHSSRIVETRPVSNTELLSGKMLGITMVFQGFAGMIALLLWIAARVFIVDLPAPPVTYIAYPLLLTLPMLLFLTGIAFLLDSLFRSRELSAALLLTGVGAAVFSLDAGGNHWFDFRGVWTPLLYSDITGFGNLGQVFLLRGMYLLLGLGCIFLAVTFSRRLSHARWERLSGLVLGLLCLTGMFSLGKIYTSGIVSGQELRSEINDLNDRFSARPRVSLESCTIELVHRGGEIEATAALRFTNSTAAPLDRYAFSLNPGLRVTEVTGYREKISFQRQLQVITVKPARPLAPGARDSLAINYRGCINEAACYPDIPPSERDMDNLHETCAIDRRYAFITPRYVLLTREALWYPVPGTLPGPHSSPGGEYDFSRYALTVKTRPGLTAISQGRVETGGDGVFRFRPETPLPKISLAIGPYEYRKTVVDSVEYGIYSIRGHDFFSGHFRGLSPEKRAGIIRAARTETEGRIGLMYPFARFSLVETPLPFLSHPRLRSPDPETVQPEQVFFPERGIFHWNNPVRIIYSAERFNYMQSPPRTPEEIREYALDEFIRGTLLSVNTTARAQMRWRRHYTVRQGAGGGGFLSQSPYEYPMNIFPEFFSFRNGIIAESGSLLGLALGQYLESGLVHPMMGGDWKHFSIPDSEVATRALSRHSLAEILSDPAKRDMDREALFAKSVQLFTILKAKSGVLPHQFDSFLREYLEHNRFRTISAEDLADSLRAAFGMDVDAFIERWANSKILPRYEVSGIRYTETPVPGGSEYHVRFTLYNPEPVEGSVQLTLSDGKTGRLVAMDGNQALEIHLVASEPCPILYVHPSLSQHIPDWYYVVLGPSSKAPADPAPAGERVVSPPKAEPDTLGIVVDNIDPGFRIIPKRHQRMIERLREQFGKSPAKFTTAFNRRFPPAEWSLAVELPFYGHTEHSAQYIRAGKGEERVRWETDIPESGMYTVFYHDIFFFDDQRMHPNDPCVLDFHFRIGHADGVADVDFQYHGEFPPWSPLGTFRFEKGKAWVELSDKTAGKLVYADAVKWVRKTNGTTDEHR